MQSQLHSICIQSRNFGICCYAAQEGALGPVKKGNQLQTEIMFQEILLRSKSLTVARLNRFTAVTVGGTAGDPQVVVTRDELPPWLSRAT